jgi:aminopeptidase N
VADARRRGKDAPIGKPVEDYKGNYETIVYAKGALFFAKLRETLGADTFDRLLRTYLERYRWRIATPADFQALAEEVSGKDLDALFNEWVYGQ